MSNKLQSHFYNIFIPRLNGKTYFECPPNYGAIVRASCVKTGDYPEVDYFDEEL